MYSLEEQICIMLGNSDVSAKKFYRLLDHCGEVKNIIEKLDTLDCKKILGESYAEVCKTVRKGFNALLSQMQSHNIVAITVFSDYFPNSLREISDPPYVLFCRGNVNLLDSRCLSVVGTRKASVYGRRVAKDFVKVLCENFTIVSGLAYGIDSVAHETTLENDGFTIAVLGGGIVDVYPSTNQGLANRIVENGGLIISEYGLFCTPDAYRFPHRNRLVAGLSSGVLVCQAPNKSGTMSTIELALDQGKDVFVVPGEIYDTGYAGSNHLIKSMQAACVTTPRDIIDYYRLDAKDKEKISYQPSFDEMKVIDALSNGSLSFDQIVFQTKLDVSDLSFLLANLELKSIIARLPGNFYRLYGGLE